ncbi:hypothetical protein KR018_002289 [Drosophila ironensis]|nr:hypothetical protein KR018_002289 [Drosophila ironensis]
MERNMQKQLYGIARESSPGVRRYSLPTGPAADSTRKSFFGGNPTSAQLSGNLKKTALNNSRHSLSVRSTQSIPGIRSDYNVVESFGAPLPVVVNEALTFAGTGAGVVTAKLAQNGWAWVVQGRRLLIWQYKDQTKASGSPQRNNKLNRRTAALAQCRELSLPYSDLGHKSELVSVFQTEGQQMASCIAVSATGEVRYWSSIAHDGNSVDLSILTGQEFHQLLNLPTQQGYLAVTTTCNLVFLRVGLSNGRYTLHHKTIKPATSILGGFGKKFASILIGMNTGGDKDQTLVSVCCESNTEEGETTVALLSDKAIQRWSLSNKGNAESLIYEDAEIVRKIRDEFKKVFWNARLPADNLEIDLHLLDFHVVKKKSYILAGAVNSAHAPQMCYGIVVASAEAESVVLESFTPLKINKFYSSKTEEDCLSLRFVVGTGHIYLYTPKVVLPLHLTNSVPTAELEAEKIEFHLHDDRILSAAISSHLPLFFSRTHGLVSITPGDFDGTELLNMSTCNTPDIFAPASFNASFGCVDQTLTGSTHNLHVFELDPDDMYNELSDEVGQMKAAFLYHLKRNSAMAKSIIDDLMRSMMEYDPNGAPFDAYKLDRIVITIAEDLAEDVPMADPRWEEAVRDLDGNRYALGSSRSMQIVNQLRDKIIVFQHFITFLHAHDIWEKMNAIPCGSNVLKPTSFILSDIGEKIVAAMALRSLQSKWPKLIEDAIDATVAMWDEKPHGSLTSQDVFYVKLCKFQYVFEALADLADERIATQSQTTVSVAHFVADINSIVLETLNQVLKHREQQATHFRVHSDKLSGPLENLPWTAMAGNAGVRDTLNRMADISVRYAGHCVSDTELKHQLYRQIFEMVDLVLDGRKAYVESVRDTEKFGVLQQQFEAQRRELIMALIKDRQFQYAAKLAEKYLDFQSLVIICDETKDKDRLADYTRKYEEYDFSQFAINWHLRQNRHGEVFERFKGNQTALAQFMRDHPSLGWIQLIFNGDFERAAKVLYELAQCETEFVARKKSMLSLAKLAALSAADSDLTAQVEKINSDLCLLEYQTHLSHDVLQAFGFDSTEQRVLKAEEIINMFIAEENDTATESEFRKALELLSYVDQPYDLRHKIWCAAIKRDNWTDYDPNNAVEYMHRLLLFKIIEISQLMGQDTDCFLPPMEDFLESVELGELPLQKPFQYLLKLTYEYVADLFRPTDHMEE